MDYTREHELAQAHPITLAGQKKAEAAVKRLRKSYATKARKLQEKAQKMLDEASEMSYLATKYSEYKTPMADLREKIEDEAYWAARAVIGVLERDAVGNYTTPAPMWNASYKGEFVGTFQGEERIDILRQVCPPETEGREWRDYEVAKVAS